MTRLKKLLVVILGLALVGAVHAAWPEKPVRMFVGFAPGGATDLLARLYAKKLGEHFNQTFIVENRPGAGGNIAIQNLTQAPPDGYTIAMAANYVAANAAMKRNPYDWQRDLTPIGMVASTPNILVVPAASPLNSVADLIRTARQVPGVLTFGSPGVGSSIHLAGELFKVMADVDMTHVPYKGVSPAEVDLVSGIIDTMFGSVSTAIPLVQSGKLKALAVTGRERIKTLPALPTIEESGLQGYDVGATYFVAAPAGLPAPVLKTLADAVAHINQQADVRAFMDRLHARLLTGGPDVVTAFLAAEERKWRGVVAATGLTVN